MICNTNVTGISFLAFIYISRFLWDAHNCEESLDEEELGVSTNYLNHWNDLVDLWYLGMQVLANLLTQVFLKSNFILLEISYGTTFTFTRFLYFLILK